MLHNPLSPSSSKGPKIVDQSAVRDDLWRIEQYKAKDTQKSFREIQAI